MTMLGRHAEMARPRQLSDRRCQVAGVRCQVPSVRHDGCQVLVPIVAFRNLGILKALESLSDAF